jgi:uncharacterized protein YcbK (DUF882 family)
MTVGGPVSSEPRLITTSGHSTKKGPVEEAAPPLMGTLIQTHTHEHVTLDASNPSDQRFQELLADRVTGKTHDIDPRLLDLLRKLGDRFPKARFEIVSGYRSPKVNEMMRKKGHHVATHSQHSLGHAVDFRIIPEEASKAISPKKMEKIIRSLGWNGGIGVYPSSADFFVHADVGPKRRWQE